MTEVVQAQIDSDTVKLDGTKVRYRNSGGAESVSSVSTNTAEGARASQTMKALVRPGDDVNIVRTGKDVFARDLGNVRLVTPNGDVDMDFVGLLVGATKPTGYGTTDSKYDAFDTGAKVINRYKQLTPEEESDAEYRLSRLENVVELARTGKIDHVMTKMGLGDTVAGKEELLAQYLWNKNHKGKPVYTGAKEQEELARDKFAQAPTGVHESSLWHDFTRAFNTNTYGVPSSGFKSGFNEGNIALNLQKYWELAVAPTENKFLEQTKRSMPTEMLQKVNEYEKVHGSGKAAVYAAHLYNDERSKEQAAGMGTWENLGYSSVAMLADAPSLIAGGLASEASKGLSKLGLLGFNALTKQRFAGALASSRLLKAGGTVREGLFSGAGMGAALGFSQDMVKDTREDNIVKTAEEFAIAGAVLSLPMHGALKLTDMTKNGIKNWATGITESKMRAKIKAAQMDREIQESDLTQREKAKAHQRVYREAYASAVNEGAASLNKGNAAVIQQLVESDRGSFGESMVQPLQPTIQTESESVTAALKYLAERAKGTATDNKITTEEEVVPEVQPVATSQAAQAGELTPTDKFTKVNEQVNEMVKTKPVEEEVKSDSVGYYEEVEKDGVMVKQYLMNTALEHQAKLIDVAETKTAAERIVEDDLKALEEYRESPSMSIEEEAWARGESPLMADVTVIEHDSGEVSSWETGIDNDIGKEYVTADERAYEFLAGKGELANDIAGKIAAGHTVSEALEIVKQQNKPWTGKDKKMFDKLVNSTTVTGPKKHVKLAEYNKLEFKVSMLQEELDRVKAEEERTAQTAAAKDANYQVVNVNEPKARQALSRAVTLGKSAIVRAVDELAGKLKSLGVDADKVNEMIKSQTKSGNTMLLDGDALNLTGLKNYLGKASKPMSYAEFMKNTESLRSVVTGSFDKLGTEDQRIMKAIQSAFEDLKSQQEAVPIEYYNDLKDTSRIVLNNDSPAIVNLANKELNRIQENIVLVEKLAQMFVDGLKMTQAAGDTGKKAELRNALIAENRIKLDQIAKDTEIAFKNYINDQKVLVDNWVNSIKSEDNIDLMRELDKLEKLYNEELKKIKDEAGLIDINDSTTEQAWFRGTKKFPNIIKVSKSDRAAMGVEFVKQAEVDEIRNVMRGQADELVTGKWTEEWKLETREEVKFRAYMTDHLAAAKSQGTLPNVWATKRTEVVKSFWKELLPAFEGFKISDAFAEELADKVATRENPEFPAMVSEELRAHGGLKPETLDAIERVNKKVKDKLDTAMSKSGLEEINPGWKMALEDDIEVMLDKLAGRDMKKSNSAGWFKKREEWYARPDFKERYADLLFKKTSKMWTERYNEELNKLGGWRIGNINEAKQWNISAKKQAEGRARKLVPEFSETWLAEKAKWLAKNEEVTALVKETMKGIERFNPAETRNMEAEVFKREYAVLDEVNDMQEKWANDIEAMQDLSPWESHQLDEFKSKSEDEGFMDQSRWKTVDNWGWKRTNVIADGENINLEDVFAKEEKVNAAVEEASKLAKTTKENANLARSKYGKKSPEAAEARKTAYKAEAKLRAEERAVERMQEEAKLKEDKEALANQDDPVGQYLHSGKLWIGDSVIPLSKEYTKNVKVDDALHIIHAKMEHLLGNVIGERVKERMFKLSKMPEYSIYAIEPSKVNKESIKAVEKLIRVRAIEEIQLEMQAEVAARTSSIEPDCF